MSTTNNEKTSCKDEADISPTLKNCCDNKNKDILNYSEWIESSNFTFIPTKKLVIHKKLPASIYDIDWDSSKELYVFKKRNLNLDELLHLPDPLFNQILNDMDYFWKNEDKFKKYNFAYKRGILLHGPPGCGKTSLTALLSEYLVNNNGIVLSIKNGHDLANYAKAIPDFFRVIEKNTPILTVIEDLDGLLSYKENETELLNLLDGFYQSSNTVYIECTNYPENLKERILNRPSRFDKRYYIGPPKANVRKFYLENKIKKEDIKKYDINYIVERTEGLSLAHLGELVKSVFIFSKDLEESISELHDMSKFISSSKYDKNNKGTGFLAKPIYGKEEIGKANNETEEIIT